MLSIPALRTNTMTTPLYQGTGGHNYIQDEENEDTTNRIEEIEKEFNRLCTVSVESGGFRRLNGTMDSFKQALWLRTTLTTYGDQRAEEGYQKGLEDAEVKTVRDWPHSLSVTPPNTTEL